MQKIVKVGAFIKKLYPVKKKIKNRVLSENLSKTWWMQETLQFLEIYIVS